MNEELKIIISAETQKLKKGVEDAKKEVKTFRQQVKEASAEVDEKFKSIGESISNGAKAMGVGIAAAGAALLALGGSTEEYRNQQAQLITAFEAAGASAETAKETYNDLYRVLGDTGQAQEAAQHLAKLTKEEKALEEYTFALQGVYASFGASLPLEGLTEGINHTVKLGEVQGSLADALEWSGISTDAFNEKLAACNTEAEREKLIRETLTGLYADAAATYEENNAQVLAQRDAQAQLQEQLSLLGEAVAPIITAFTSFATDALAVVVPYIQQLAAEYMPMLQEVLAVVAETLGKVMGFLVDNWDIVLTVAAVIGGIATAIGLYNAVAAVKAAMDAAQVATLGALIAAYAAQAAAMIIAIAPYVLIVAAIAAVVAAIVYCVKHWDEIKAKVVEVATAIWGKVKEMAEKVSNYFSEMKEKIAEKAEQIKAVLTEKFNAAKEKVAEATNAAKEEAVKSLSKMKSAYQENGGGIKGIVAATMEGVKGSFSTGYTFLNTLTNGKFGEIVSKIRTKLSEAKAFITDILGAIKQAFSDKLEAARNTVSNVIERIKSIFNFEWSLPKLKMPSIKITGKFSLNPPSVPKFSINWNALGGVFDKPTIFGYGGSLQGIGEDGAEAVVPLEKNTQWLDRIAERLAAKQGSTPIVLTVDGKVFAQTSIDTINQLTKQTGSLGLVMA